jgi:hypothetical protein
MKKLTLLFITFSFFAGFAWAQIQMESLDFDTPQIWASPNGPHIIVKIDTIDYELVGLSETDTIKNTTTWTFNIDQSWIKEVLALSGSEVTEKHGYAGVEGVHIITLG